MMDLTSKLNDLAGKKADLAALKAQFDTDNKDLTDAIKDLEEEITEAVLAKGETVKTDLISAIWVKGETTWDGKLLEGYALAHPDILQAQKVGKPTVSFRMAK